MRASAAAAGAAVVLLATACSGDDDAPEEPAEDGCARLVSAIGFADPLLPPSADAPLESAVRGRLGYVEGTVTRFEDVVPDEAQAAAKELRAAAAGLTSSQVPVAELGQRLQRYRAAVDDVESVCAAEGS